MIKQLCKQGVKLLFLLFVVTLLAFFLVEQAPTDYVQFYVGAGSAVSTQQKEEIRQQLGLNEPAFTRYVNWLTSALQFDLGESLIYRKPVTDIITERFGNSLALMLTAWLCSGVFGLGFGIFMGLHQGKAVDYLLKSLFLAIASTPTFFVAVLFIFIFSVTLSWFPMGFSAPVGVLSEYVTLGQKIHHMILPALTLSCVSSSHIALHTRETTIQVMESEYILFAKTRNIPSKKILFTHSFRNILLPSVTLQFASLSELMGGSVLAETAFSYGGLGSCLVEAGLQGDTPLLLGITMCSAVFVFVGNATANLLYAVIDPRIRRAV